MLTEDDMSGAPLRRRPSHVVVIPSRGRGHIDRNLFGGFVEHLGRCINGGLFEPGSALSDKRGFRQDVLDLLRPLKLSVLRWPGGNFASNYHWTDGIGPVQSRPGRLELAWGGVEPNKFGTDEYLDYCAELAVAPYICLNMGTGDLAEALAWLEYCNGRARTQWTQRRRQNGHEEPYGVVYWGLGNEMYGDWQVGQLSAPEYVARAARWAKAMRRVDPSVKLVSCGMTGWTDWDRQVAEGLTGLVDLHSLHIYTGSKDYWTNVLTPHQTERAIRYTSSLLSQAAYNQKVAPAGIAYDEWNVWYRTDDGSLEERYDFDDALAVATYLNIFVRECRWVRMANLAQMVNAIAPVVTTATSASVQPPYHAFLLTSQATLDEAVDTAVHGPRVPAPEPGADRWGHRLSDLGPFQVIDAAASTSADGARVAVTLVNRAIEDIGPTEVSMVGAVFSGPVRVRTVTDAGRTGADGLAQVDISDLEKPAEGGRLVLDLPPRSFTVVEAAMETGH